MEKAFIFTMDDNIRFLQELIASNAQSIFDHPYTRTLKELHEKYGVKIQLNLFYKTPSFTLSQMTENYKKEWQDNASWLKLSFHSLEESPRPYLDAGYDEVYNDCQKVHNEILRFAGEESLAKTTTLHFTRATNDGLRALKECGVQGLLGLYGTDENPRSSYQTSKADDVILRHGGIAVQDGIAYAGIDIILDRFTIPEILTQLKSLSSRKIVKILIHEQYFYKDYARYQPEFRDKLETAFTFLTKHGYVPKFLEDVIL